MAGSVVLFGTVQCILGVAALKQIWQIHLHTEQVERENTVGWWVGGFGIFRGKTSGWFDGV